MEEILKCCDEVPDVITHDLTYDAISNEFQSMISCSRCGHHIHSQEDWEKAIPVWNTSARRELNIAK